MHRADVVLSHGADGTRTTGTSEYHRRTLPAECNEKIGHRATGEVAMKRTATKKGHTQKM